MDELEGREGMERWEGWEGWERGRDGRGGEMEELDLQALAPEVQQRANRQGRHIYWGGHVRLRPPARLLRQRYQKTG